jgi:hypothetical protein
MELCKQHLNYILPIFRLYKVVEIKFSNELFINLILFFQQ